MHHRKMSEGFMESMESMESKLESNVIAGRFLATDRARSSECLRSGATCAPKRIFDITFSVMAIIMLAPVMAVIALLIKLDSRGSVLFKQKRNGMDGKVIEVWKFRSMYVLENGERVTQAVQGDPRVTGIGRILRKYSLDELPQFFNVLSGAMSVVGPRPHAVAHNEEYRDQITNYSKRHMVRPGITGWAQVNGARGETDTLDKMATRVGYDLDYINHWSLKFDVRIVCMTVLEVFNTEDVY